ncbi:MAG: T9SS type A sorting domain-containing protein [bacterium]|nr:MAG: T9SS type A sorting domain-containing protein [bacterium]
MKRLQVPAVLLAAAMLVATGSVSTAWEVNGICVVSKAETRHVECIIHDGVCGAIIGHFHETLLGNSSSVLAAKIDWDGNVLWNITLGSGRWDGDLHLVPDGSLGAFAVYTCVLAPTYNAVILGKRIISNGSTLDLTISGWDSFDGPEVNHATATDGANGVIIAWERTNIPNGTLKDIVAQRITNANNIMWGANGTTVREADGHQTAPRITSDGAGGAIVTWLDGSHIYAQRVYVTGTLLWTADGIPVCTAVGGQDKVHIIEDGAGGAFIAWQDGRGSDLDIYMQRITADGTLLWVTDGIVVCNAAYNQDYPILISDTSGGVIVVWRDGRDANYDVYAQRIDGSGDPVWPANGVPVAAGPANQRTQRIVPDTEGGAIVSWMVETVSGDGDIYIQRIDQNGDPMWGSGGVPVCTATGDQSSTVMTEDCMGGAILAWNDYRDSEFYEGEIYAQRVLDGLTEAPQPDPVRTLVLSQNHPNPFNPVTSITFTLFRECDVALAIYDTQGRHIRTLTSGTYERGPHTVIWNGCDRNGHTVSSGIYFYRLTDGREIVSRKMVLIR